MNTICIGRLYFAKCGQAAGAPLVDRGFTNEKGTGRRGRCFVIRPPFARNRPCNAIAIGWWGKPNAARSHGGSWQNSESQD